MESCMCCGSVMVPPVQSKSFLAPKTAIFPAGVTLSTGTSAAARILRPRVCGVRASAVDSYGSSFDFIKRTEQAWLISQQPRPVVCPSCDSKGHIECKWCAGTGFFILGDNMLCEVPSRNTSCLICSGKGFMNCADCKGTGYRAKWMGDPPVTK